MATVLLAHSYFLQLDPKQHAKMKPYPPLNTLHAATVLRNDDHGVAVFDAMLAADESEFQASLDLHRPEIVVMYEDNFNFLSKMCLTRMREAAVTMIGMARAAGCRVAACGADVTDHPEVYLEAGAEACLLGEGEHTMREVVSRWLGPEPHQSLADIPGIATLDDGQCLLTCGLGGTELGLGGGEGFTLGGAHRVDGALQSCDCVVVDLDGIHLSAPFWF